MEGLVSLLFAAVISHACRYRILGLAAFGPQRPAGVR